MKILFKIYAQKSHLNASFGLAHALVNDGHLIVYAGSDKVKSYIESQGFSFFCEKQDLSEHKESVDLAIPRLSLIEAIKRWNEYRRWKRTERNEFLKCDCFDALIAATAPDLMLIDSPYVYFALAIYKHQIPFAILESMGNLNRDTAIPPYDTKYVPSNSLISKIISFAHWERYFIKRAVRGKCNNIIEDDRKFVLRTAKEADVPYSEIEYRRYFHIGLKNAPEFILSPKSFDFPRPLAKNQCHLNLRALFARHETHSSPQLFRIFEKFREERKRGYPIVYCALGTAPWLYAGALGFFGRLIKAVANRKWNLIVAMGSMQEIEKFGELPKNVVAVVFAPQLSVLAMCDVMITHGGMNSIAECIEFGVPMIVCPGNNETDQSGNAARVAYHRLGVVGSLTRDNVSQISERITMVLRNSEFSENVKQMAEKGGMGRNGSVLDGFYEHLNLFFERVFLTELQEIKGRTRHLIRSTEIRFP
jgi:zeaxanthin glucosyltransferase